MIRNATNEDAEQIVNIYNYYIINTTNTLEVDPIDTNDITDRLVKIQSKEKLPYLVFEEECVILGFAYATVWRSRAGYRFSVESSVYVKNGVFNKKIGTKLYTQLINELRELKYHDVIGVLTLPNDRSAEFHEKFGFVRAGFFPKVGRKFDTWLDVGFWQLKL